MLLNVKKTKKHIAVLAVAAILVIGAAGVAVAAYAADNTSYNDSQESIIKTTGATIVPSSVDFGTHLDVELTKGGALVVGRETWDKGDEIIFRISADEDMELYVGILPAESMDSGFGYNDYGFPIDRKVDVSTQEQEVSFTIPETGEYGIYVRHIKDDATTPLGVNSTVTFDLEINRKFENSLVAEDYNPNNGVSVLISVDSAGEISPEDEIMPQDTATDWAVYNDKGELEYYRTLDENGKETFLDYIPEAEKGNAEMDGNYFVGEQITCVKGIAGEHKKSNGHMAIYTNNGDTWSLAEGDTLTITFDIKAVDGHENGQGIQFGYLKDGIYTEYTNLRLLGETSITFYAPENGEYNFFFINASSDTIYVNSCSISAA